MATRSDEASQKAASEGASTGREEAMKLLEDESSRAAFNELVRFFLASYKISGIKPTILDFTRGVYTTDLLEPGNFVIKKTSLLRPSIAG